MVRVGSPHLSLFHALGEVALIRLLAGDQLAVPVLHAGKHATPPELSRSKPDACRRDSTGQLDSRCDKVA
eukprot:267485-Pyramimonas_sp.AAC.1